MSRGRPVRAAGWIGRSLALVMALSACATVRVPDVTPLERGEVQGAWARVLDQYVNDAGQVDFAGLARDRRDLDRFVEYVGRVDPETDRAAFPTPESRLAYRINAYNALSMYAVLELGIPRTNAGLRKIRFFWLRRYRAAGRNESLFAYEKRIRDLGDARVHFALNCMSVSCPRLPREPFRGELIDAQLDAQAREFFGSPQHLQLDASARRVEVSEILKFYRDEFLRDSATLIEYVNRYRDDPIPGDYELGFLTYDWTINRAPSPAR